ncbi:uncharacterized protein PRCAT00001288001 [Priceomyces carsonii]|uniref:uncharacterized protein n=1 Tax=Priceomyces carsonii TaxID=28549 RepID=UPI002ED8F1EC|nr:unnamed protein product [Priceomyces carsonii]
MSRFFASGYSSESSSEEEALMSTSEEEILSSSDDLSTDSEFENELDESSDSDSDGAPKGPSYFLKKSAGGQSDSDSDLDSDDEGRKVVKSAKEKLLDDMKEVIEAINISKRTNKWTSALSDFEKLGRLLTRSSQQRFGTPKFYIACLAGLEDYINETAENEKLEKSLNAAEARAFNTARQRVRKQIKEYQAYCDSYRKNPEAFESDEPLEAVQTEVFPEDDKRGTVSAHKVFGPVFTILKQISETRGKKNIDKHEQIQSLEDLLRDISKTGSIFELISTYQMLLSVRFDASSNQTFMPVDQWTKNKNDLNSLLDLLEANKDLYQVSEIGEITDEVDIEPAANDEDVKVIFGSITSLIERIDDEFTRSLQNSDPHSLEYIERLKDEGSIYELLVRGQSYVELITPESARDETTQVSRIVLRRLEHIYYKPNQLIAANEKETWKDLKVDSKITPRNSDPNTVVEELCDFLSKQSSNIYRSYALLYNIYYHAVNDEYSKARELFLKSQIYYSIQHAESPLQIQYNRALVQLGLSAFRASAIEESHQTLMDIANSQRTKELLGQGFNTKYPSQATAAEKQRLLPFHMHINLELLECVYMTSSLLIEIPALAAAASSSSKDSRRKASVKSFKSKLEFHDRQYFTGPPESIKDHIVYASRALQKGDWLKAYDLLASIKIWKLFPNHDQLLEMMKNQLQVEGLRTYIFTYRLVYSKLSVSKLSQIFSLDSEKVVSVLQRMIDSNEVNGTLDDDKYLNFISTGPQRSRLQELAIVMNEKVGLLAEKNEKTASNGHGRKQPQQQQQQQQQQKEQKEFIQEENNKFRCANVNTNNDEFQAMV